MTRKGGNDGRVSEREYAALVYVEFAGHSVSVGIAEKRYGSTVIGKDVLPTSRTIYPIASITKIITGIMLLQFQIGMGA